ncbi:hypothetical protein EW146_g8724 [Bondarzewia mesenterica]|uniref:Uncharacterized protein n=1 Tax=Bondarzewia mesenterica TaxID=1095465 RepID=A0A4S4LC12_9AGAM|nr:hypothetical protein EW146_g8724 [Bondarzewia mesenterica]
MSSRSRSSQSSLNSIDQDSQTSPLIHESQSSAALILVQDDGDDPSSTPFDFSSDDDLADDFSAHLDRVKASPIPPLPPTLIFLYLLTPFLKLGPMFMPSTEVLLAHSIPALLLFAFFAACSRQLWYMLAKYVHKADLEEVMLDAFARGRGKERRRRALRLIVSIHLSLQVIFDYPLTLLSCGIRIGGHVAPVCPCKVACILTDSAEHVVGFDHLAVLLGVLFGFQTTRLHYIGISFCIYRLVRVRLICSYEGHAGSTIAFTFASSWTLPLYASLQGSAQPLSTTKKKRRSFKLLSVVSIALAVALTLPLCFFAAHPNPPETSARPRNPAIAAFNVVILMLTIPSLVITTPHLPVPLSIRRSTNLPISMIAVFVLVVLLSLLPRGISAFDRPATSRDETDELLQRKERTLQRRRLTRRLVWDVMAWVLFLPIGGGGIVWAVALSFNLSSSSSSSTKPKHLRAIVGSDAERKLKAWYFGSRCQPQVRQWYGLDWKRDLSKAEFAKELRLQVFNSSMRRRQRMAPNLTEARRAAASEMGS